MDLANVQVAETLKSELENFRSLLRSQYPSINSQVTSRRLRNDIFKIAESSLLNITSDNAWKKVISADRIKDLTDGLHKIAAYSERATARSKYEIVIKEILEKYFVEIILPLKASKANHLAPKFAGDEKPKIFVGHSFNTKDSSFIQPYLKFLEALGLDVVTGEKPKAMLVSEKVKKLIGAQDIFLGIFLRDERLLGKESWTTSPWIISEAAHASAKDKKLILLVENGIDNIGGIHGDHEYIKFQRTSATAFIKTAELFNLKNFGLNIF
jgi:hypothetical protein